HDGRYRDVEDGVVEDDDEEAEAEHGEYQPSALVSVLLSSSHLCPPSACPGREPKSYATLSYRISLGAANRRGERLATSRPRRTRCRVPANAERTPETGGPRVLAMGAGEGKDRHQ